MAERHDYLVDGSPLITAAALGKLRLVRLLVEGGAQVNERNQRGETPLLAACRALRANQSGNTTSLRLIHFLLQHSAEPNAQDKAGRTPLMYACMEHASIEVVSALISAGADPNVEDYGGASALVYAINAQDQDTVQVLLNACRAKGRDIIIVATDLCTGDATVSQRYLHVEPSPDTSPVMCMSPSDIELKTYSPNSENESEGIFNFKASEKRGSRANSPLPQSSEPGLTLHKFAHLGRTTQEQEELIDLATSELEHQISTLKLRHSTSTLCRNIVDGPPQTSRGQLESRRNTLPALPGQNLLQLPTISFNLSSSDPQLNDSPRAITLPPVPTNRQMHQHECNTLRKWNPQEKLTLKHQARSLGFLPLLTVKSPAKTSTNSWNGEASPVLRTYAIQTQTQDCSRGRSVTRRHSVQLE